MAQKDSHVRIKADLMAEVNQAIPGEGSKVEKIAQVLRKGLDGPAASIELDTEEEFEPFSYLSRTREKPYYDDLRQIRVTEEGLVKLALEKTGLRYDDLLKQALLSYCKDGITNAYRNEWLDKEKSGVYGSSTETRIKEAFAKLTEQLASGEYNPRGGKVTVTAISQTAKANYRTTLKWVEENQPELLQK